MGTASTAPLAGRGRSQRVGLVRFVRRAFGPNVGGAQGSAERRAFLRFALVIPIANFCGAIDVFAFLWWVLPLPQVPNLAEARMLNMVVFAVLMVVTFVTCGSLANKCADPIARW